MALNFRTGEIPKFLKIIIIVVPAIVAVVLFITLLYAPKHKEINRLGDSIAKLDNDIASAEVKARKLDELKAENERLKLRLAELREYLPEEKEVSLLLKQISDLGVKSGLAILLWKPGPKRPDPSGVYTQIPVNMEVISGYHDLGVFFGYISRLKRIVNISDIKMSRAKEAIKSTFTASTFSAEYESTQSP